MLQKLPSSCIIGIAQHPKYDSEKRIPLFFSAYSQKQKAFQFIWLSFICPMEKKGLINYAIHLHMSSGFLWNLQLRNPVPEYVLSFSVSFLLLQSWKRIM